MGTIKDERICKSLLRIIVCHYYLRCSYQLHGSVMATKSFLTCLNLQILRQKIHIAIYTSPCVNMSVSVYPVSSFREEMGFVIFRYKCNEFNWNEQLFSLQFMNKASPYFLVSHAHCIILGEFNLQMQSNPNWLIFIRNYLVNQKWMLHFLQ